MDLFQEYGNAFFIALFTLEMLVKMYSLGLQVSLTESSRESFTVPKIFKSRNPL